MTPVEYPFWVWIFFFAVVLVALFVDIGIERRNRAIRADEERQRRRNEEAGQPAASKPKAAVMNVDVQVVLSRADHKTFAEAKAASISRVTDGEPLWLYVKFNGKLGDYVLTQPDPEEPAKTRYVLFTEIGPQGDVTALNHFEKFSSF